ncbi:EI24 domain-containing protein [Chloroflexus sp.]|uniref:EI24 domain-containing protein n=1 Tax=Chloroflexus sp. TaxID=1904827 RepID=UPI002ADE4F3C|nr:EI24 domain-containing protein [Chloroflexus sp.]
MHTFLHGLSFPLRALGFIVSQPMLWRYIVIPIVLNILIGFVLYATLLWAGVQTIEALLADWPELIARFVRLLLIVILFIGLGYMLVRFGVVIGSPFYSRLSELIEERLHGVARTTSPTSPASIAHDFFRALLFELKKLLFLLALGTPTLLLNVLPGIGAMLATVAGIAIGVTISCLDFFDPPLERRRLSFRTKLGYIRHHLPASAGFGLICLGLVSVPFLNLLAVPVCITAGTLFFCERSPAYLDDGTMR